MRSFEEKNFPLETQSLYIIGIRNLYLDNMNKQCPPKLLWCFLPLPRDRSLLSIMPYTVTA